jgi:D-ornithine 4,5-aminomutase subunit beta
VAHYFENIDPQPDCVITTEIASGKFEDDIRRMRIAAWHGADHIMVIRTMGQSHYDGIIEGTPEGTGGIVITRKQLRATRKALDLIEEEVGRPINFHSYVSGLAGPEMAVLFSEEGVNGAHQDPQYNVLYRNINMIRSFVDAAEAKKIMANAKMLQIDGAHNANATALKAWKIYPELFVQHAINALFSLKVGISKDLIALSTVPPTASPAPKLKLDLPYAVALREVFEGYKFRAQMNTRYIESDTIEATRNHILDLLISRLTSVDIQSTITPDEGRNVPWHYNNVNGINTAKQILTGLDGLYELVEIKKSPKIRSKIRELKERAVLFLEGIIESGGYFESVESGFFIDSGFYPERNFDGISRDRNGGVGASTVFERSKNYIAPVCDHFGDNNVSNDLKSPCDLINGCTICNPGKIMYIDELDETDNVHQRLKNHKNERDLGLVKPEVEWCNDGIVVLTLFLPLENEIAGIAGLEVAKKLGLSDPEIINMQIMHPSEGTYIEIKGKINFFIDVNHLLIPDKKNILPIEYIKSEVQKFKVSIVAATVGNDEHSVGMREIIDIKHGGLEKFGIKCHYLGTSVPIKKVIDSAIELGVHAILISNIISHNEIHKINMTKLHELCVEKGVRDNFLLIAGGPQVDEYIAKECKMDMGFGRKTTGHQVASYIIDHLKKSKMLS